MKTELLFLAAGQSVRFGGIKQLAIIGGQPMINLSISAFHQEAQWLEGITKGYVVLGANAELIQKVLATNIDFYTVNYWQNGMGQSLAESMQIVESDTTHVMVGLADQVAITQQQIAQMLDKSAKHPDNIIAAKYANKVGAPAIFPRQYFSQLAQLTGDKGAKLLLQKNIKQVVALDMPEAEFDLDTQEDLINLRSKY